MLHNARVKFQKPTATKTTLNQSLPPMSVPDACKPCRRVLHLCLQTRPRALSTTDAPPGIENQGLGPAQYGLGPVGHGLGPRGTALAPRNTALDPCDTALALRDTALARGNTALAPRDTALAPHSTALAPRDRSLALRDRSLAPRDTALAPRNQKHTCPRSIHLDATDCEKMDRIKKPWEAVQWNDVHATTTAPHSFSCPTPAACPCSPHSADPHPHSSDSSTAHRRDSFDEDTAVHASQCRG